MEISIIRRFIVSIELCFSNELNTSTCKCNSLTLLHIITFISSFSNEGSYCKFFLICGGSLAPCSLLLLELVYVVLCSQKDRTLFPLN